GNDGRHIRKFRQTIRDAWERQVSAVYPEARADFDTTVIRLHASPPPLQQKLVRGRHLRVVTDDTGTPASSRDDEGPHDVPMSQRFLPALAADVGAEAARAWLKGLVLEQHDGIWILTAATRFSADWIRAHFDQALRRTAAKIGLAEPPLVRARPPASRG